MLLFRALNDLFEELVGLHLIELLLYGVQLLLLRGYRRLVHRHCILCDHGERTALRIVDVAHVVVDLEIKGRLVNLDLVHDAMLRSTFVALSAAVIARACRNDVVFACIRSTISTLTVLFVVEDVSMSWCDCLGRVASVGSAAAVLPLLGRLVV